MRGKLLGVVICATMVLGLGTASGASAKGLLELNNQAGEHLMNGSGVNITLHTSTTTTVSATTYADECSASSGEPPATLAENGTKDVFASHAKFAGGCSGGPSPSEEGLTARLEYVRLTSGGKAQLQMQKNFAGPSDEALLLHIDHVGAHESCTYEALRLKGTFATASEALVISGSVSAKLFKSVPDSPSCAKKVAVTFTAELFETGPEENPLKPELVG